MASLGATQIYQIALQAGFPPDAAVDFTAIALAESGGDPAARNNTSVEDSRGLWQINVKPGVRSNTWGNLYDPLTNARAAYDISGGGRNLRPWSVTHHAPGRHASYERYLAEAREAAHEQVLGLAADAPAAAAGGAVPDHVRPIEHGVLTDSWHASRAHSRVHEGIDIFAPSGTPIHAVTGGTIVKGFQNPLGGVVVRIQGDDGNYYYYAHLKEGSADQLHLGQHVSTGQVIGQVGNTGDAAATSPHLHLQVRHNGEWVNPYSFLQPFPDLSSLDSARLRAPEAGGTGPADDVGQGDVPFVDSDRDGLSDAFEKLIGTDPDSVDTDHEGLTDYQEVMVTHTDPSVSDTDNNGESDAVAVAFGHDPGVAQLSPYAQQALASAEAAVPLAADPATGTRAGTQAGGAAGQASGVTGQAGSVAGQAGSGTTAAPVQARYVPMTGAAPGGAGTDQTTAGGRATVLAAYDGYLVRAPDGEILDVRISSLGSGTDVGNLLAADPSGTGARQLGTDPSAVADILDLDPGHDPGTP